MSLTVVDAGLLGTQAQYTGFKNRIINGAMGIWQRGTTTSTAGTYIADRWFVYSNSGTITGAQSTDVPSGFKYSMSISGSNYPQSAQYIESLNCVDLSGQTVTVSFWAKQTSGAGAGSLGLQLSYANTVDSWGGGNTVIATNTFTATGSWAQYSYTFTNLPSGALNGLKVLVYGNTTGSATIVFTGVQLEKGSTATSFDYRPYGTELALCQRYYYQITGNNQPIASGYNRSISVVYGYGALPVPMRIAPSLTAPNSAGYFSVEYGISGSAAIPTLSLYLASPTGYFINGTAATSVTAASGNIIFTANASSYVGFSSELL